MIDLLKSFLYFTVRVDTFFLPYESNNMKNLSVKYFFLNGLMLFILTSPAMNQDMLKSAFESFTVHEYKKSIIKTQLEIKQWIESKNSLVQEYDSNVIRISELKQKKEIGFFERVQLKKLLKDSEDLSQQIVLIDKQITNKQESNFTLIDKMIPLMEYEIKQTLKNLEKQDRESDDRTQYIQNLQSMINEKLEFQSFIAEPLRAYIKDVKFQRGEEPETLIEKSDFLMDQADKLQRYIAQIETKIDLLETENEIKKLARKFIDDIYSFDKDREMKLSSKRTTENTGIEQTSVINSRPNHDDISVAMESNYRGTSQNTNPLFLNTTLEISSLQINAGDDFKDIIRKLKLEKSLALNREKAIIKTADELRRLAEIKLRYSR